MRTPEHRAHPRAGKKFEAELDMHYLSPGAFTVLPLDPDRLPDPPPAPPPYRFPVGTKRHRHKAFAIIGEPTSSSPNSRSSSPSGRLSPFKGHGFNPAGSRHASPTISPIPPEDPRAVSPIPSKNTPTGSVVSRIPKPAVADKPRKSSTGAVFGEKVSHIGFRGLSRQASQSLTSLEERQMQKRPPPSPRKKLKGAPAFKQLSPIQGSSPEPSQSLSSPSRIPTKSKSTPPSRISSPTREKSKVPVRSKSKSNVAKSRDPSPLTSPTKIPVKKYQHVQSKINSFNKPKPPPKPPLSSDMSEDSESPKKKVLARKHSLNRSSSRPNLLPKTFMGNKNQNYTSDSSLSTDAAVNPTTSKSVSAKTFGSKVTPPNVSDSSSVGKTSAFGPRVTSSNVSNPSSVGKNPAFGSNVTPTSVSNSNVGKSSTSVAKTSNTKSPKVSNSQVPKTNIVSKNDNSKHPDAHENLKFVPKEESVLTDASNTEDSGKLSSVKEKKADLPKTDSDDGLPSALNVVSSTTNTVTKPLKIETPKLGRSKPVSPMIDGRVLSATSVSQAINKMNDTVLNTQTLIKDSGLPNRLTPAASAVIAVKSECNEKKGGIYDTTEDNAKQTGKEQEKVDGKVEEAKKFVDKTITRPTDKTDTTKVNEKMENTPTVDDKTAKIAPHNVNTHPSSTKTTEPTNSMKIRSSLPSTINNHATNNHSNNHVTTIGLGNAKALEREVQNNMNKLLGSMDSNLGTPVNKKSANDRIREARTVIAADVKPIRITVKEKPSEMDVQSGNVGPHFGVVNGVNERPSLPPSQQQHQPPPPDEPVKEEAPPNRCKRFLSTCSKALTCSNCQRCKRTPTVQEIREEGGEKPSCFKCLSKKSKKDARDSVRINIEDENGKRKKKKSIFQNLNCCKKNKVGDTQSCFPIGKRKRSWVEKRAERKVDSFLESEVQRRTKCCSKEGCKNFFRKIFCCCCKKKQEPPSAAARKESMVSSKKKSLTPTSMPPQEDPKPKIDESLVEHASQMKGAIPVLPVWLAWFCCIMNCIGPGTGTVLSGLFCLCIGKPRFSQKDGPKPRIGAFIIDVIIGFSQFFTVLFCLVGWGWSIWWGVIMVKIARKHRKFKHLEKLQENSANRQSLGGNQARDAERGRK